MAINNHIQEVIDLKETLDQKVKEAVVEHVLDYIVDFIIDKGTTTGDFKDQSRRRSDYISLLEKLNATDFIYEYQYMMQLDEQVILTTWIQRHKK